MSAPDVTVTGVYADDDRDWIDATALGGSVNRVPGPRGGLVVRIELSVDNPSPEVFEALRGLVGLTVDLVPRPGRRRRGPDQRARLRAAEYAAARLADAVAALDRP